jgi:hypothetical protein
MKLSLNIRHNSIEIDRKVTPGWANLVKRWYQLDGESFAIAEASFRNKEFIGHPTLIVFVSSEGCSSTDSLFVNSEKFSPSFFVQTVPNVRSLPLCFVTGWEGSVICLSKGSMGLTSNLAQFSNMIKDDEDILIVSTRKLDEVYNCDFYKINTKTTEPEWILYKSSSLNENLNDIDFREKTVSDNVIPFYLSGSEMLVIRRNNG